MELEKNLKSLEELSNQLISAPSAAALMAFQEQVTACQKLLDKNTSKDAEKYFQSIMQKEALREILARLEQQEFFNEMQKSARKADIDKKDDTKVDFDQIAQNVLANMDAIFDKAYKRVTSEAEQQYNALSAQKSAADTQFTSRQAYIEQYQAEHLQKTIIAEARAEFAQQAQSVKPSLSNRDCVDFCPTFAVMIDSSGAVKLKVLPRAEGLSSKQSESLERSPSKEEFLNAFLKHVKQSSDIQAEPLVSAPSVEPAQTPPPKAPGAKNESEPATPTNPKSEPIAKPAPPKPTAQKSVIKDEDASLQHQIEKAAALGQQDKQERLIDKVEQNTGGKDFYTNERVLTTEKEIRQREAKELYNPQATNVPIPLRQETALVIPGLPNIGAETQPATARLRQQNTPTNENTASNSMRLRPPPPTSS